MFLIMTFEVWDNVHKYSRGLRECLISWSPMSTPFKKVIARLETLVRVECLTKVLIGVCLLIGANAFI